jgi:hypothetical protein
MEKIILKELLIIALLLNQEGCYRWDITHMGHIKETLNRSLVGDA